MSERLTILYDSQEQTPWSFDPTRYNTVKRKLRTGDYTLEGFEDRLTIERKTLGDLVQTVIQGWIRFRKELYRMAGMDLAIVAVEANVSDVIAHRYESDAQPASVMGRVADITIDHGIPVYWWGSRGEALLLAEQFLTLAAKKLS